MIVMTIAAATVDIEYSEESRMLLSTRIMLLIIAAAAVLNA